MIAGAVSKALAVYTVTRWRYLLRYWVLMEFDGLLGFELAGEHLMSLDVLVEDLVPLGIRAPCAVESVLGLDADQVRRIIIALAGCHERFDQVIVSACILEFLDKSLRIKRHEHGIVRCS